MTSKKPEISINTTLSKFGAFLKVLAFLVVGAGGTVGYNKITEPETLENQCSIEIEKRLGEYNQRLVKVETRMDNTDLNIVEIKSSLVRIESYLLNQRDK